MSERGKPEDLTSLGERLDKARRDRRGTAAGDGKSAGAPHQFVAVDRFPVASHCGGHGTVGDGTLGPQTDAVGRALGQFFGHPRDTFLHPCPQRGRTKKLPSNSRVYAYQ